MKLVFALALALAVLLSVLAVAAASPHIRPHHRRLRAGLRRDTHRDEVRWGGKIPPWKKNSDGDDRGDAAVLPPADHAPPPPDDAAGRDQPGAETPADPDAAVGKLERRAPCGRWRDVPSAPCWKREPDSGTASGDADGGAGTPLLPPVDPQGPARGFWPLN